IYAVHLRRAGATYRGRAEVFLKGRPLNVTGLDFGPDGAMYFVTGGRRTQSGLYRVRCNGQTARDGPARSSNATAPVADLPARVWRQLDEPDRWRRYAARLALEARPASEWRQRAL